MGAQSGDNEDKNFEDADNIFVSDDARFYGNAGCPARECCCCCCYLMFKCLQMFKSRSPKPHRI